MLRRLDEPPAESPVAATEAAFPSLETPFVLEERPAGIRFYRGRSSVFHPYALLQTMRYSTDALTLTFGDADVVLHGRGLHELYVALARQRVALIVEQGGRFALGSDATLHITRIEYSTPDHTPRESPPEE